MTLGIELATFRLFLYMVNITSVSEEAAISDNAEGRRKFLRNSSNFNNLNMVGYSDNSSKNVIILFCYSVYERNHRKVRGVRSNVNIWQDNGYGIKATYF
jgi:hypothetical protein